MEIYFLVLTNPSIITEASEIFGAFFIFFTFGLSVTKVK
jgi:hypothetical protein